MGHSVVRIGAGASVTVVTTRRVSVVSPSVKPIRVTSHRRVAVVSPHKTIATIGRVTVVGVGDVVGPNGGVTDGDLVVFSGSSGKFIRSGLAPHQLRLDVTLSPAPDGVTDTFSAPEVFTASILYYNGMALSLGEDYIISGGLFIFTRFIPETDDRVSATYTI